MNRYARVAVIAALFLVSIPVPSHSESKVIMIGEAVRGAMYAPFYIADAKGYFKKRDLDPKIITFSRATTSMPWLPAISNLTFFRRTRSYTAPWEGFP